MFTGIIQTLVPVKDVRKKPGLTTFDLEIPATLLKKVKLGASIAVDGVCLTVVKHAGNLVTFDAMEETLKKTTIGELEKDQKRNVERSFQVGDEIGGHIVSGHVHGMVEIIDIKRTPNNQLNTFKAPATLLRYIFPKGFIALDGVSLTVVDVDEKKNTFTVSFIPETLKRTVFGIKEKGAKVNVEVDQQTQTIVSTIERILKEKKLH